VYTNIVNVIFILVNLLSETFSKFKLVIC